MWTRFASSGLVRGLLLFAGGVAVGAWLHGVAGSPGKFDSSLGAADLLNAVVTIVVGVCVAAALTAQSEHRAARAESRVASLERLELHVKAALEVFVRSYSTPIGVTDCHRILNLLDQAAIEATAYEDVNPLMGRDLHAAIRELKQAMTGGEFPLEDFQAISEITPTSRAQVELFRALRRAREAVAE